MLVLLSHRDAKGTNKTLLWPSMFFPKSNPWPALRQKLNYRSAFCILEFSEWSINKEDVMHTKCLASQADPCIMLLNSTMPGKLILTGRYYSRLSC